MIAYVWGSAMIAYELAVNRDSEAVGFVEASKHLRMLSLLLQDGLLQGIQDG